MRATTTIKIDSDVRQLARDHVKKENIRGGFSAYIEILIKKDLKVKK